MTRKRNMEPLTSMDNKVNQLADVLNFLIASHPSAIKILVGEVAPPTSDEIMELVEAFDGPTGEDVGKVDVSSSNMGPQERVVAKADRIERIIADVGGWNHIVGTVEEYRKCFSRDWDIFFNHVLWIGAIRDHSRLMNSQLERIARKFGISEDTIQRRRKDVPRVIAKMAVMAPVGSMGKIREAVPA